MARKDLPYSKASDTTARNMARRAIHAASKGEGGERCAQRFHTSDGTLTVEAWLIETGVGLLWSFKRPSEEPEVQTFREAVSIIELTSRPSRRSKMPALYAKLVAQERSRPSAYPMPNY